MIDESLLRARGFDADDPLRGFRDRFVVDDPSLIYLDGNSLGRLPKATVDVVSELVRDHWGGGLVGGWKGWYDLPQRLGAKIAELIGAAADEVLVCDSTSVNLFKLTIAALQYLPNRRKVVTDNANFPSDLYVTAGAAQLAGRSEVKVVDVESNLSAAYHRIESALFGDVALLSLSHTLYKSGYVHDMKKLTRAAHDVGGLALWDLSHSVGAVPVDLVACDADLAVGCCYKYLNGGPGAPAFLYVRRDLQSRLASPIWGWFGQRNPFDFGLSYEPAVGLDRFLAGTPPVLSMAAVEPGVDLVVEAGMDAIRAKSLRQTTFLLELVERRLVPLGFASITPRDPDRRGSHVALVHRDAWRISQALIQEMKVIPDFRAPDVLRLGVTPLYTTYEELVDAVERIAGVVEGRLYEKYSADRARVT